MPEIAQQRRGRSSCVALVLTASLSTSGCFFGKKTPKVFVPPPVYAKTPPAGPKPQDLPAPPEIGSAVDPGVEPVTGGIATLPPAPPKSVPPAKPAPSKPPATVVDVTPPPVTPAPKPTAIFTAAERQRMNQEIDQSLGKVRAALARVEGRTLSPDLAAVAANARAQMQNAEQTRVQDLVTAVSLAKRAESFAIDLVQRLP